jgi:hypothetical protein
MKIAWLVLFCGLSLLLSDRVAAGGEDVRIYLFSHARRSGTTNEWWLPVSRFSRLPKWNPEKDELPLPLGEALRIARHWIALKPHRSPLPLESVTLIPIQPNEEEFRHAFYYQFLFRVDPFDSMACIVLMDGTVLEPDIAPPTARPAGK